MARHVRLTVALVLGFALIASACGSDSDDDGAAPAATTAAPAAAATTAAPAAAATTAAPVVTAPPAAPVEVSTVGEHLGDGSLGVVEVGPGEAIQIR
ncbi:MAG: hypothetical protein QF522_08395, partial [Acidimicrobiales bacterium]|nr:hypothetical protein [Acidimicrobiales bacterium]